MRLLEGLYFVVTEATALALGPGRQLTNCDHLKRSFERNTVDGCARVCDVVESFRRRIGGEDLSDAYAFLKWIYQKKLKPAVHK